MTEAQALAERLDAMMQAVATAHDSIRQGAALDLTGLDRQVDTVCTAARTLPRAEARALAPRLADLADRLDRLAADLTAAAREADGATAGTGPDAAAGGDAAAARAASAAYARPRG